LNEVANSKADGNVAAQAVELPFASRDIEAKFRVSDTMLRWCLLGLEVRLKALILTGSLARNEATWQRTDQGIHFLSDAEFIVIVKDNAEIPSPELVTLVCSGAEEELRNKGIFCKLSFGAVHEAFLSRLGETIFGYELLTCGEVLYGDPDLLRNRSRCVTHVSEEDAWRMLANRTVELLEIVTEPVEDRVALSEAAQYRLTKLYCDMATSILVFKQEFVAGYQARADKLCDLHERGVVSDLPFDMDWFVRLVARCTEYKITHVWDGPSPFTSPVSLTQAVAILRSLWAWELSRMHGVAMSSPEAMQQLHMRKQRWRERLRGWAFVVRRQGARESLRHGLPWLALLRYASPRYCVYTAGLGAVSGLQFADSEDARQQPTLASSQPGDLATGGCQPAQVLRWLPVPNPLSRTATGERDLAEAVLWNYREFLVQTRA
jgi:hypothetical protein